MFKIRDSEEISLKKAAAINAGSKASTTISNALTSTQNKKITSSLTDAFCVHKKIPGVVTPGI